MGARPSTARKSGGGFWKGQTGTLTGYRWTDQINGEDFVPGKKPGTKDDKFHSLFMEVSVRKEGADEDQTFLLFGGDYDAYEISQDELTLTSPEGGECSIGDNTGVIQFMASYCACPPANEEMFSDDPDSINYEPMIGSRVQFDEVDVLDKNGDKLMRKAKKGKFAGKEFPVRAVIVSEVYELAGAKNAAKGRGQTTSTSRVNGKGNKAVEPDAIDVAEVAATALLQYLESAPGKKLNVQKLKAKVATDAQFKGNAQLAKDVYALYEDGDIFGDISEITYNKKAGTLELDA